MLADRTVHVVDDDAGRAPIARASVGHGRLPRRLVPIRRRRFSSGFRAYRPAACCWTFECRAWTDSKSQARLNRLGVTLPVIVMTGHGDVPSAVQAMKAGAVDFLEKPFDDETLLNAIEAALAKARRGCVGDREAVDGGPAHSDAKSARAGSSRCLADGTPEQGDRLRPQHQRADGRGPSCAHDGAARNKAARRCHSPCGDGQVGAAKARPR